MIKINSSFPVFIVKSTTDAKAFYTDNFDFQVVFENEWYLHLVSGSGVQVGFMLPNQPTQPQIFHESHNGSGVIFSVETNDAESAYFEAKERDLDLVLSLRSEDWGQRHFVVKDPNGVYLDIVQVIEPKEEYQSGYETE
ncbi:VOC family protein [Gimesia fumaroli]|uniref:Glyoxalase-like domain protein n=1 Tax=Gimesia fumaroli TaxID=2527976 RepID=A0A518IGC8_9PLAN|nr:VOC family protein [Gimesia fumaroli]QDV52135.1 Glyoxalase-like domain protein [Gimesia fumaroli]